MMKIKTVGFDVAKQQSMTQSAIAGSANPVKVQAHGALDKQAAAEGESHLTSGNLRTSWGPHLS